MMTFLGELWDFAKSSFIAIGFGVIVWGVAIALFLTACWILDLVFG